jgi:hypothetical protein
VGTTTLALVAGLAVTFSLMVPDAHAANQGSPETLWEAFPLDPSQTGPGTGANGITLKDPEPLPSAPPESADDTGGDIATEAVPPAARTGVDGDAGAGGVGAGALLAIAAVGLLVIGAAAAAIRMLRTRTEVSDASSASPEPDRLRHRSPCPSSPADEAAAPVSELRPAAPAAAPTSEADLNQIYGPALCLEFASGLGDEVLERAIVLFGLLSRNGSVDSVAAADALGVTPGELPGLIITPLRRRADALSLPVAYIAERDQTTRRRRWRDRDGVAGRLREAAITIKTARAVTNGDAARAGEQSRPSGTLS